MALQEFSPAEREQIVDAYLEAGKEPVPPSYGEVGCLLLILLVLAPTAAGWMGWELRLSSKAMPFWWPWLAGLLLAFALLLALVLLLFGSSFGTAAVRRRAEESLDLLSRRFQSLSDAERRRQAARLVSNAYHSGGPWTVHTIDFEQAREQLGEARSFVETVEQVLLEELQAYPVFTRPEEPGQESG